MKFNQRYRYDKRARHMSIGDVVERIVYDAASERAGELEEMRAMQAALINIVARMAQELSPESQERLANYFGFDVAEEKT